jgi:hypothetical protein
MHQGNLVQEVLCQPLLPFYMQTASTAGGQCSLSVDQVWDCMQYAIEINQHASVPLELAAQPCEHVALRRIQLKEVHRSRTSITWYCFLMQNMQPYI